MYAYISGKMHSGQYVEELRMMLKDYDRAKAAWDDLCAASIGKNAV